MPVIKANDIRLENVGMEDVRNLTGSNVVGPNQGWKDYTMRLFRIAPDGHSPHHEHGWEHINYVVRGKGRLRIEDDVHEIEEGDYAFVPPNKKHQFSNPYDKDFEFICIVPNRGA